MSGLLIAETTSDARKTAVAGSAVPAARRTVMGGVRAATVRFDTPVPAGFCVPKRTVGEGAP